MGEGGPGGGQDEVDVEGKGDGEGGDVSNQKGHHQEGGRPQDVKNSGSGVMNEVGKKRGSEEGT